MTPETLDEWERETFTVQQGERGDWNGLGIYPRDGSNVRDRGRDRDRARKEGWNNLTTSSDTEPAAVGEATEERVGDAVRVASFFGDHGTRFEGVAGVTAAAAVTAATIFGGTAPV